MERMRCLIRRMATEKTLSERIEPRELPAWNAELGQML